MATFLSSPWTGARGATPGERRFAERLRSLLEDDYLCWYDVPIGPRYQHPDFPILHPARGILVLEVKDWRVGVRGTCKLQVPRGASCSLRINPDACPPGSFRYPMDDETQ
jgi:hypothetical protein